MIAAPQLRRFRRPPRLRADWELRFNAWLERACAAPHSFGQHDCLLDTADAIDAQTGRDFAEGHRYRYRSAGGAARYLRRLGFANAEALLDSILPSVPPAFAQRGDIVLWEAVPGVCIGADALFRVEGEATLVRLPRGTWSRAWAVGRRGMAG